MTPFLKNTLEKLEIEDIVITLRGVFYFEKTSWQGPFQDPICEEKNLFILSRKIADRANITLGLTQPSADSYVDFQDKHFFRAHVVIAPMSLRGTEITLRRIRASQNFQLQDFLDDSRLLKKLKSSLLQKKSILIAGITGAGKSSLLTALMNEIPVKDRVVILEDSPELPIPNEISSKLLARSDRFGFREGAEWDLCHLVFECLRMRPDRMIIGECRGPEARAIHQALMTGHKGVMTTLHAGSCSEALHRFEELVQNSLKGPSLPSKKLWDLILHIKIQKNGSRKVEEVLETHL
ncbi:MAG: CpaF/VirB11 family protein [bacterium]